MSSVYTISELAKEFKITTRAIRHYEDEGLLCPSRDGTSRLFNQRDRVRLKLALRGKRLGFSLAELRELFDLYDNARDERKQLEVLLGKLERHRAQLEQRSEDIAVMLSEITFFENQCRKIMADTSTGTPQAGSA
jgi:DNA-binding transcriptional MerR regulator